jgi:16S rRNA (guanine527-N7)-methyltransferase
VTSLQSLAPRLRDGLAELGLVAEPLGDRLLAYLALLLQWNRAYNLTAIREPEDMLSKHLLDSLVIHPHVHGSVVDIGTGPGLPGIPLALALPELRVSLVETAGKKARFLREAVRHLDLSARVRVHDARAQDVDELAQHDCLAARAFGTLEQILAAGGHLLKPGGRLLAMKGRDPSEEIAALPHGYRHLATHPLAVPGLDAERHLVVVEKFEAKASS